VSGVITLYDWTAEAAAGASGSARTEHTTSRVVPRSATIPLARRHPPHGRAWLWRHQSQRRASHPAVRGPANHPMWEIRFRLGAASPRTGNCFPLAAPRFHPVALALLNATSS